MLFRSRLGYKVVTGGTDNHVFLIDISELPITGAELQERCDENHITLNKNAVPGDKRPPKETSGVRVGTAPMTTRGYNEEDFVRVAGRIDAIIKQMTAEKDGGQ